MGPIDIVINNAGVIHTSKMLDHDDKAFERVFQVNVFSHFWVCHLDTIEFCCFSKNIYSHAKCTAS